MSFPRYQRYKSSDIEWVGEIPAHWQAQPLYRVAAERAESNDGMIEDNLLSLSYGRIVKKDIASNDGLLPESFETYQIVYPDDQVLRLTDLQNDKRSLRSAIVHEKGIITSAYLALKPTSIDSSYLSYLLRAYDLSKVFYSMGGGLRQSMKFDDLKRMPVLLPSEEEQVAIAEFLNRETAKIDALVEEQNRLIALLKEKRQAIITQAVTQGLNPKAKMKPSGVEWLGDVPEHWDVAPIGYRYTVQLGKMLDSAKITGDDLRPYLRVFDVQWRQINTEDLPLMDFDSDAQIRFRLLPGDLLVNEGGSYVGRSAIWRGELQECYYQKALHRVRPLRESRDTADFLINVMEYATVFGVFVAGGNQTTIDHLTAEQFRRYRFPFPPFSEQVEIASYLESHLGKLEELNVEANDSVGLLQERRSALVSAAVTGKIDVRGLVTSQGAA